MSLPLISKTQLIGATSFTQFQIDTHRCTIIGEYHLSAYNKCSDESISTKTVADFFKSKCKNSELFIEVPPKAVSLAGLYGSKNINDIYESIRKTPYIKNLRGFDIRPQMLNCGNIDILYHRPSELYALDADIIHKIYISTITNGVNLNDLLVPDESILTCLEYEYLKVNYLQNIYNECHIITNCLMRWEVMRDQNEVVKMLKHVWKKIADYFMIVSIFMSKSPVVILCGEMHAHNIFTIFKKYAVFRSMPHNENDCIDITGALW